MKLKCTRCDHAADLFPGRISNDLIDYAQNCEWLEAQKTAKADTGLPEIKCPHFLEALKRVPRGAV